MIKNDYIENLKAHLCDLPAWLQDVSRFKVMVKKILSTRTRIPKHRDHGCPAARPRRVRDGGSRDGLLRHALARLGVGGVPVDRDGGGARAGRVDVHALLWKW